MQGRPPKRLTPEQQQAADLFIDAAEPDRTGKTPSPNGASSSRSSPEPTDRSPHYPWEAPHVRDDVTKGYPLRLPEKLYLKLKFVSEETGQSMNQLCNDAVAHVVEKKLAALVEEGS